MQIIEDTDYDKKTDLRLWKKLVRFALKYPKVLIHMILTTVVCAGVDIVYPLLTRYAVDHYMQTGNLNGIGWFIAVYVGFIALQGWMIYQFIERTGRMEMNLCYDIREAVFHKLQELSFSFYDRTPVGYLMARMVSDISRISDIMAWGFTDAALSVIFLLGAVIAMFILKPLLALIVMAIVPPLVVASIWFQRRILRLQRDVRKTNSRITSAFSEGIMGAMTTKTLVREQANFDEFSQLTGNMKRLSVKSAVLSAIYMPVALGIASVGMALALSFGGVMVTTAVIGLGTLAAFVTYTAQISDPIQQIARVLAEFQTAQASAERVVGLLETENDIAESAEVIERFGDNFNPKKENWPPIKGDIEFEQVSFKYKIGEPVLNDFSLKVKAGETIALVGETGAGKSTIVNLICRFYEPTEGRILIDGTDYRERSSLWLESSLGYVLQTPHLFSGTIEDNIKYGCKEASRLEVIEASKMACAHDFIEKLAKGYETEVGEGGALLSTGQKQLVSFARVILADPRIFVLDEATSSIDTETERLIQRAITQVLKGRTSFLVAHRLSTIRSADRILVIRGGGITEQGNHTQLMAQKGYYYNLYTNQFRQERQDAVMDEGQE